MMPITSAGDVNLYFERAGQGEPLLFISGSGGDLRNRPNVLDGPLAKRFDVLTYDQRGLGQSEKPDHDYTMADYADDADALMTAMGWTDAHVVGVSFGGMVALELAIRHPRRLKRLVLACTSPGGAGGSSFPFHELAHLDPEARARRLIPVSDTRRDDVWASAHPQAYEELVRAGLTDAFAHEVGRAQGYARQLAARAGHDTFERLHRIAAPTLIAAGRYDGIARPEAQQAMAEKIPGATLQFFEGGHMFLLQDRTAFSTITAFLGHTDI